MPDQVLMEEPLQFGEGDRLSGVLTRPTTSPRSVKQLPVFVFLSAGLLHRVGPYRLHVRLGRELAQMGFSSLRVDLAGIGDSPPRPRLSYRQSIAADFADILGILESRLGRPPLVLAGLCAGSDIATNLALKEPRVVGMVLLDPVCFPVRGARPRLIIAKYTNPENYVAGLKRRLKGLPKSVDSLALRDLPTREEMRMTFESIQERGGRVLSVFTRYALGYYNQAGHLGRVLDVKGYQHFCTELFWPQVDHTYPLELHRRRLMDAIKSWASDYTRSRITSGD